VVLERVNGLGLASPEERHRLHVLVCLHVGHTHKEAPESQSRSLNSKAKQKCHEMKKK
jgi:hypothetical protein